MKLYVCFGTKGSDSHSCARAYRALKAAGYDPELEKVKGSKFLPKFIETKGRKKIRKMTGNNHVPTLVLDDGTIVDHSQNIVEWASKNRMK